MPIPNLKIIVSFLWVFFCIKYCSFRTAYLKGPIAFDWNDKCALNLRFVCWWHYQVSIFVERSSLSDHNVHLYLFYRQKWCLLYHDILGVSQLTLFFFQEVQTNHTAYCIRIKLLPVFLSNGQSNFQFYWLLIQIIYVVLFKRNVVFRVHRPSSLKIIKNIHVKFICLSHSGGILPQKCPFPTCQSLLGFEVHPT